MTQNQMNMIDISRKAVDTLLENNELTHLYSEAIKRFGEGDLRNLIMETAVEATQDEYLKQEVFSSEESMFSLFCGIWIQFLLSEIAGVRKDKLQLIVKRLFQEGQEGKQYH